MCPSLGNVSEAPGARLRSRHAHMGFRNGGDGARLRWRVERLVDGRRYHDGWGTSVCRQPRRPSNNNVTNVSSHLRYSFCPLSSYPLSPYPNSRSRDRSLRLAAGNRPAHMRWTCKKKGERVKRTKWEKKTAGRGKIEFERGKKKKKKRKRDGEFETRRFQPLAN